jgi:hypothetical protein
MRMMSADLVWVLLAWEFKINCQLHLSVLLDDFCVGRRREMKQFIRYLATGVVVGISFNIVKEKIGNRVKMVNYLQVLYQVGFMADPGKD